jgi:hypothetical protein
MADPSPAYHLTGPGPFWAILKILPCEEELQNRGEVLRPLWSSLRTSLLKAANDRSPPFMSDLSVAASEQ